MNTSTTMSRSSMPLEGYDMPVSAFTKYNLLDGSIRNNVAFEEKRTIAGPGTDMASGKLHSVRHLLLCMSARYDPSVPADR